MNPTAATVLLAAAFVSPALQAQEPPAPPPPVPQAASKKPAAPKELEEIVVVATRRAEDPYDVPQATDVVSGKRLKERPPATFGDVFRGVPGVWQTESGNGRGKTPVIRGLTGNQILTLFDGRRLNNAMFPPPGPFTLHDTIDPEDIERVEVLKGPGSVLYGTGAVGGVVNVIPKEPPSFTPGGTLGGELRLRGSSADNGFRTRMVGEGATAGTRFRVGATHETLGDLRTGDGLILSPLAQQSQHLDGTFYLATGEDSNLRFRGEFSRLDSDRDFLSPGTPRTTTTDRSSWGLTWNRENLGSPLADKIKLRLWNATWDSTSTRFDRLDRRARKVDTWGVDLQADSKWREGQRWTWGMEAYIDQASDLRILSSGPENGVPDGNQLHVAGYAQDELKVLDDLEIVAGLRGNFFRTTTSPRAATLPAGIRLSEADIAENEFTFTGSLGAVAHLSDAVSLAANGGRGFRVPGIRDLAGVN
ncbi:MAG: TonB-dependent receptor plug domain-containing protein, partial [Planctomycetota bacterium]